MADRDPFDSWFGERKAPEPDTSPSEPMSSHYSAAAPRRLGGRIEQSTPAEDWDDEPATSGPVTMLDHALAMIGRGCKVIRVQANTRRPVDERWQNDATDDAAKVKAWVDAGYSYGISGGHPLPAGGHLLIVDLDVKDGKDGVAELAKYGTRPETFTVRSPSGGLHLYFSTWQAHGCSPGGFRRLDESGQDVSGIDIRGRGGQCVGPGCMRDGKSYEVVCDAPIAEAPAWLVNRLQTAREREGGPAVSIDDPDDIVFAIHYLQKDAPIAVEGRGGNNTTYAVAARVVEIGVSAERAADLMAEHWNERCLPPWTREELLTLCTNAQNYVQTRQGSGGVAAAAADWQGAVVLPPSPPPSSAAGPIFDPWREVIVPALPQGLLPGSIDRFASEQSTTMGACRSAIGLAALAALSGAVNHATSLRMMRNGGWSASPRLWLLLAGPPSSKKTPIIGEALRPLEKLQAQRWRAWKEHCDFLGEDDQKPPQPARLVAGDVTMEALAGILAGQDRGVLVKRDELAGWIGSMEKYGSGRGPMADRAFWLEAFNGGPYTVDRVTRGSIVVPNLSVSIIGGIQPDRLTELQGLQSDGLLQRFLPVFVEPGRVAEDRPVSNAGYSALIESAAGLDAMRFEFDDAALKIAARFRQRTHDLQMAAETTRPGFAQFVGKLDGLFGTLSLLFHVAEGLEHWFSERVISETAERVETLFSEFILPHAFEFYGFADQAAGTDKLRKIASWVLTSGRERLTTRDAMREVSCLRDLDAFRIGRELGPLVAGGWLEPDNHGPENRTWKVLPGVLPQFAERRAAEERRKQELARLMNGPRRASG
ncbi:DUF3987 domain-containing protein [uncultured Bosea sp.]|uniref:DUF3987 domain-containing protein n=1 Tax=uncultured Bosea sp. TaxID=211457 RepID=UPI00263BD0F4|nr:DUF3987 domain-containing protein [uncultured Bosea sp.]